MLYYNSMGKIQAIYFSVCRCSVNCMLKDQSCLLSPSDQSFGNLYLVFQRCHLLKGQNSYVSLSWDFKEPRCSRKSSAKSSPEWKRGVSFYVSVYHIQPTPSFNQVRFYFVLFVSHFGLLGKILLVHLKSLEGVFPESLWYFLTIESWTLFILTMGV